MSAIGLDGVTVHLGGRAVVRDVTATVERGEWVALIGPNGAGKTTLLRAIAGLLPHEGTVSLLDREAAGLDRRERARLLAVAHRCGVCADGADAAPRAARPRGRRGS